jgi:dihydroflavonol-4-reductase
MAAANEIWAGITKRPALISLATVQLMGQERERTRFNREKSERELGIQFRPVEETLSDTVRWYQQNGWLKTPELKKIPLRAAGQRT